MSPLPQTMRAVLIRDKVGPSSALYIGDAPTPKLADGQNGGKDDVIVKVKAFGLNRMDLLQREGKYPIPPGASPILGVEFSGHVAEVGARVSSVAPGDEVFGLTTGGAYADYVRIPAPMVMKKPTELSWVQAASMPEAFLTAFQALHVLGSLQKGEDLLVHAGASGVGLAAIQLAKAHGARHVYVTAGSEEKIAFCKSLGATAGFNYKTGSWKEGLMQATDNQGVDVIMDFVGAPYFADNLASLKRDGRLTMQGFMGGAVAKDVNLGTILTKRLRIEGSTLRSRSLDYQSKLVQDFFHSGGLQAITKGVQCDKTEVGSPRLVVYDTFDWNEIRQAHDTMAANKSTYTTLTQTRARVGLVVLTAVVVTIS